MSTKAFNINTSEVVKLTNKLEKMHKSAMPVSVRGALNDAAFDMKKNQLEKVFESKFITRKKNFIRSHTLANKSKNTFNLKEMASEVGVIKGKSDAGDDLDKQELGGIVRNRSFIPMDEARIGKNKKKLVSKRNYLKAVKAKRGAKNFVKAAFKAGKGGTVLFNNTLFYIKSARKLRKRQPIKAIAIYSYRSNRSVSISKAPFLLPAAEISSRKIPDFFIKQAERRLNK